MTGLSSGAKSFCLSSSCSHLLVALHRPLPVNTLVGHAQLRSSASPPCFNYLFSLARRSAVLRVADHFKDVGPFLSSLIVTVAFASRVDLSNGFASDSSRPADLRASPIVETQKAPGLAAKPTSATLHITSLSAFLRSPFDTQALNPSPGCAHCSRSILADMVDDSMLAAVAEVVSSLAAQPKPSSTISANIGSRITLPGPESASKRALEIELQKLTIRVGQLENRVSASTTATLPETPNEANDSLFGDDAGSTPAGTRGPVSTTKLANAHQGSLDSPKLMPRQLTKEALEGLRDHVDDQSKLLDSQRQELAGVNAQLLEQKELQERALAMLEQERVATLERELWKHQKANEAFQKALREIGEIVTAVARGDLTMKVRMNTVEMDPEITTFKRTINAMMDQLQIFASEVSRVAREVGTEGLLGGQARIGGVDGTWKELTDNGMTWILHPLRHSIRLL